MKLSIIVPCYNEKNTIHAIIEAIKAAPFDDKEIIIVDDCSSDGTREILRRDIEPLVARVLYHDVSGIPDRKSISRYLVKIARLGGYLARASDPPPGSIVMWRGLSRLTNIELGAMVGARLVGN